MSLATAERYLFSVSVTAALPDGDFNKDGAVNDADYDAWRKGIGVAPTPENGLVE